MTARTPQKRVRLVGANTDRDAAEVGYRKPPAQHQFPPGRSGNPKGRPKGSKGEATILHELFNRRITIRVEGKERKISMLEAILLRFCDDALRGNPKSAAFLFNRYGALNGQDEQTTEPNANDQEILEAFARKLEAQLSRKREKP